MTTHFFRTTCATLMLAFAAVVHAEKAPDAVNDIVPELKSWGTNATLIAAVTEQNNQGMTLDDIKARDAEWRNVDGSGHDINHGKPCCSGAGQIGKNTALLFRSIFDG
ncbi:hypothetical protein A3744_15710 [Oleiphilus sp. HI0073]|uniref:hypothetical protein n=1 Tax=unclassified Oleiphilus TaxID=2631174 RepID=UPI0007CFB314|nr:MULTISPECIES: hypothetical protein [unclassified Oleiphilus]KZY89079.1 hypothetical protein A3744_15710 [Oleiphilus sp. HI0073]